MSDPSPHKRPKAAILLVDDEPDVLDSLRRLFRKEYVVHLASSAEQAFEVLSRETVQLVMSDQRMPDMSGVAFLTEVRARYPDAVRMLFTGYSDLNAVIDAINEGHVYRYIAKPFDPAEMRVVVRQGIEWGRMRVEREQLLRALEERNARLEEQYRALQSLDELKSVFMDVVSHELNTPTTIILGYSSLLLAQTPDVAASVQAPLERIHAGAQRLKQISEKIAAVFSGHGKPYVSLQREDIDASELLDEVLSTLAPALLTRGQHVEAFVDADLPPTFSGERVFVRDVLMNLLVNAIKFSPDGETIAVSVGRSTLAGGDEAVRFSVADRGAGIPEEDRSQIFETFFGTYRSKHHSSGDFGFEKRGIGLGLAIVKRFTEMHGGFVDFESVVGEGTVFHAHFPVEGARPDSEPVVA